MNVEVEAAGVAPVGERRPAVRSERCTKWPKVCLGIELELSTKLNAQLQAEACVVSRGAGARAERKG